MSAPTDDDAVLAGLRRHARHLVAELAGPVRRVRLRSGQTVLEVEWHGAASAPPAPRTAPAAVPCAPAAVPCAPAAVASAPAAVPTVSAPAPTATAPAAGERVAVRAPIVGTFYRAPEPGAAPFVAVGDLVRAGQVVGIVEAMKLMNEVVADRAGRVVELPVADGQPVEYDQPLIVVEPV
ncbi:acetyl-CoA carboxylase biotin carboxyl carrier protein subunit [Micromonospora rosaria]|uniref:Biotin carboxyl carrier protein of acetyl-CoA carboxylase n=1 Tax=Micromonospora rosaria TaxID=47874 RepID=A0A136PI70_9ACTN|nr:acetyl-CoA carboxylase biotin carboxyl carrier protein [Micromonospora rosaria]KXK58090.1 acetyl-CoA carboxylase biotin carboxyl carrier protein subunit [Micromonospora rosaria]